MAYFACAKATLTGTDKTTRISIANNKVSPTYVSTITGKEHLRGVVQFDAVTGRNMDYVTSRNLAQRASSARLINQSESAAAARARASVSNPPQAFKSDLHESSPGVTNTTTTVKPTIKMFLLAGAAAVIGYMVMS